MDYVKLGRTGLDVSRICLGCMSYGGGNRGITPGRSARRRANPSSRRRSKPASTSSTPPTVIRSATAKRSSVAQSGTLPAATRLSSPPRYTDACAPARTAPGFPARRSLPRSTPASAASAWTQRNGSLGTVESFCRSLPVAGPMLGCSGVIWACGTASNAPPISPGGAASRLSPRRRKLFGAALDESQGRRSRSFSAPPTAECAPEGGCYFLASA